MLLPALPVNAEVFPVAIGLKGNAGQVEACRVVDEEIQVRVVFPVLLLLNCLGLCDPLVPVRFQ